ncbi:MAG TPA: hypothetical protein VGM03_14570 [Phycisphaerae bacterium]|jgi:DNA-binding response OmpR family regulator
MVQGQVLIASDLASSGKWTGSLENMLAQREVGVRRTWTGPSAVDFIRRGGIDMAVLGFDSPGDGLATLRLIRAVNQLLPCMVVAREVSSLLLRQALMLGVSSVLTEPIDVRFMTALIGRLLPMMANRPTVVGPQGNLEV